MTTGKPLRGLSRRKQLAASVVVDAYFHGEWSRRQARARGRGGTRCFAAAAASATVAGVSCWC